MVNSSKTANQTKSSTTHNTHDWKNSWIKS